MEVSLSEDSYAEDAEYGNAYGKDMCTHIK